MFIFSSIALIGVLCIIAGAIFGEILTFFDFGDGAVSLTSLGAAGAIFGGSGMLALSAGWGYGSAYFLAALLAFVVLVAVGLAMRALRKHNSVATTEYSLVGATGVVTSEISDNEFGQVRIYDSREKGLRLANSSESLADGIAVRVIEHNGSTVRVARLTT
jgi:membrane protein implicated in regulation of membrane protease activity